MSKIKLKNSNNKFLTLYRQTYGEFLQYYLEVSKEFFTSLKRGNEYKNFKEKILDLSDLTLTDKVIDQFGFYSENNSNTYEEADFDEVVKNTQKLLAIIPALSQIFLEFKKDVDLTKIKKEYLEMSGSCSYQGQPANERMYFLLKWTPFSSDQRDCKKFLRAVAKAQRVSAEPINVDKKNVMYVIFQQSKNKEGFIIPHHPSQNTNTLGDISQARTWKNLDDALAYVKKHTLRNYQIVEVIPVLNKVMKSSGTVETDMNKFISLEENNTLKIQTLEKLIKEYEEVLKKNNIVLSQKNGIKKL